MNAPFGTLRLPDGTLMPRPGWSPDPALLADHARVLADRFFLLRIGGNDGVGEVWRCGSCGGRHSFMTLACIERPFCGLDQIIYALYQQAGDLAAVRSLDPRQRARRDLAAAVVTPVLSLPDLATLHPQMARARSSEHRLEAYDIELGGVKLGRAEQIPPSLAQKRLDQINQRRPGANKLHVGSLEVQGCLAAVCSCARRSA